MSKHGENKRPSHLRLEEQKEEEEEEEEKEEEEEEVKITIAASKLTKYKIRRRKRKNMNVSQRYEEPAHHTIQLPANVAHKIYAQSIMTRRESRRREERKESHEDKAVEETGHRPVPIFEAEAQPLLVHFLYA